jgi:hypothetical protein
VTLAAPKKLRNPFEAMQARAAESAAPPPKAAPAAGGAKKLTWSERQAQAKKQQEEEEAASRGAGWKGSLQTPSTGVSSGAPAREGVNMQRAVGAAAIGGASVAAIGAAVLHQEEEEEAEPDWEPEPERQVKLGATFMLHKLTPL